MERVTHFLHSLVLQWGKLNLRRSMRRQVEILKERSLGVLALKKKLINVEANRLRLMENCKKLVRARVFK